MSIDTAAVMRNGLHLHVYQHQIIACEKVLTDLNFSELSD